MPEGFWTEVSLRVTPQACDAVSDLLQALTGNGVQIQPPIEALGPDEGYILDEKAPLLLLGYLYGPVSGPEFETLVERLVASVDRNPRTLRVLVRVYTDTAALDDNPRVRFVRYGRRSIRRWQAASYLRVYEIAPRPDG